MKYITRELYNEQQPGSGVLSSTANRHWMMAQAARDAHQKSIHARLPLSMRTFAAVSLHDGVIVSAEQPSPDVLRLQIDGHGCPWRPIGDFTLTFTGVKEVSGLEDLTGDWWLYEEVDLHPEAAFEYRVLLTGGEFCVAADEVSFDVVPPRGRSRPRRSK